MSSSLSSHEQTPSASKLVIIDYKDMQSADYEDSTLLKKIDEAFGPNGTGIIGIRNVPDFVKAKNNLLSLAHPLVHMENLESLEDPKSMYNAGWSHGKEMIKPGQPDLAKGSFYFNPLVDQPGTEEERARFPMSYPKNVWPTSQLPELEPAAKCLGSLVTKVAIELCPLIDRYVRTKNSNYQPQTLYNHLKNTDKVKGRLLYYYPLTGQSSAMSDSWCGWHNDSGFLTALAGDMLWSVEEESNRDNEAGLYVVNRQNNVCKVDLPKDCMAIQIGECAQIITGGAVVATPHCVKGVSGGMARSSFACFIDTPPCFIDTGHHVSYSIA
mmetsp:Transcript_15166/g.23098  ORF Transcript_15166/g.23098 Transcript_15166/m.23098 type:complete len:326 (+) Transcript_15166:171-1148(+)